MMINEMKWGIWVIWEEAGATCANWFRQRIGPIRTRTEFDTYQAALRFIDDLDRGQFDTKMMPRHLYLLGASEESLADMEASHPSRTAWEILLHDELV